MRTWLKRMVAGIVSAGTLMGGGLLMAGTANADEIRMPDIGKTITSLTASAATTYPRELVNGGFDYLPAGGWNVISPKLNTSRGKFTSVDPVNGQYIRNAYVTDGNVAWVKWDGFDASKFGWISDQKAGNPKASSPTTQTASNCSGTMTRTIRMRRSSAAKSAKASIRRSTRRTALTPYTRCASTMRH